MAKEPKEGTYYKIHVKGSRKKEYDISYAVWIDGQWHRRVFYDQVDAAPAFTDTNMSEGYDYEPLGEGMKVTSFEEMENQEETAKDESY